MHDRIEHLIEKQVSRGGHSSRARSKSEYVSRYEGSTYPPACLAAQQLDLQVRVLPGAAGAAVWQEMLDAQMLFWKGVVLLSAERSPLLHPSFGEVQGSRVPSCGRFWGKTSPTRAGAGPSLVGFRPKSHPVHLAEPTLSLLQQKADRPQAAPSHSSSGNMSFEGRSELKTLPLLSLTGFPCLTAILWPLCSQSLPGVVGRGLCPGELAAEDRHSRGGPGRGRRFVKRPHCCPHWVPRSHGCQFGGWDQLALAWTRWLSGWRARFAFPGQSWVCWGCSARAAFTSEGPHLNRAPCSACSLPAWTWGLTFFWF